MRRDVEERWRTRRAGSNAQGAVHGSPPGKPVQTQLGVPRRRARYEPGHDRDSLVVPLGSRVARAAAVALRSTYEVALVNPEDRSHERLVISVQAEDQARLEALRQWARRLYAEFRARWLQ